MFQVNPESKAHIQAVLRGLAKRLREAGGAPGIASLDLEQVLLGKQTRSLRWMSWDLPKVR